MKLGKLTILTALITSSLFAGSYTVDKSHSSVGFKVKHMMLSNVRGTFDKFSGVFNYDEKTKQLTSLSGKINTSSVNTDNEKRDGHLKSDDMLGAKKFPQIFFVLNKIQNDYAYGTINIKGIKKDIKMDFENNGMVVDPWGNHRAGFALEGKINRKDFNLTYNDLLESGGLVVGDTVKLSIEIEGIKNK